MGDAVGTINYSTGLITLPSLTITSTVNTNSIEIITQPKSNDIVPVRNQLVEIDFANSTVTAEVDTIESGGSSAGTGYTTTSSY